MRHNASNDGDDGDDGWVRVYHPVSTLAVISDAHVMDMRWAVCGSSSRSPHRR